MASGRRSPLAFAQPRQRLLAFARVEVAHLPGSHRPDRCDEKPKVEVELRPHRVADASVAADGGLRAVPQVGDDAVKMRQECRCCQAGRFFVPADRAVLLGELCELLVEALVPLRRASAERTATKSPPVSSSTSNAGWAFSVASFITPPFGAAPADLRRGKYAWSRRPSLIGDGEPVGHSRW